MPNEWKADIKWLSLTIMEDARQFNICDTGGRYLCPACGFPGHFRGGAYDERGGLIGSGICACCLWEPGFDDDPAASGSPETSILSALRLYRERWMDNLSWRGQAKYRPADWDGLEQLKRLFEISPHVR